MSRYRQTRYLKNAPTIDHAPADEGAEVAFAGRSNAGKSSAINAITDQKALARTSKTPGRTQHLVFFSVDEEHRLVDLPGYGFARVPEKVKRAWGEAMERYLRERRSLRGLVLVMDVRRPLTEFDRMMIGWCSHLGLPLHILPTKADKLKRGPASATLLKVRKELEREGVEATVQLFSALKRQGVEEARRRLDTWLGYPDTSATGA